MVCDFYSNLTPDVSVPSSPLYHIVFVQGAFREFSPALISDCLNIPLVQSGRDIKINTDLLLEDVVRELSEEMVFTWPDGGLMQGSLGLKYYLLHRNVVANWLPYAYVSTLSPTQARFLFMIGTCYPFCLCKVIFDTIVGYAVWDKGYGVVAFPFLISQILLAQDCTTVGSPEEFQALPSPLCVPRWCVNRAKIGSSSFRPPSPPGPSSLVSPTDGSLHSYMLAELAHLRGQLQRIQSRVDFVEAALRAAASDSAG